MKFVQERLGHGNYQITADVYSHISKRLDQKSIENMKRTLVKSLLQRVINFCGCFVGDINITISFNQNKNPQYRSIKGFMSINML